MSMELKLKELLENVREARLQAENAYTDAPVDSPVERTARAVIHLSRSLEELITVVRIREIASEL